MQQFISSLDMSWVAYPIIESLQTEIVAVGQLVQQSQCKQLNKQIQLSNYHHHTSLSPWHQLNAEGINYQQKLSSWVTGMKLWVQRKAVARDLMRCIYTRSASETKPPRSIRVWRQIQDKATLSATIVFVDERIWTITCLIYTEMNESTVDNHRQKPFIVQLIVLEVVTIHAQAWTRNTNELRVHAKNKCKRIKAKLLFHLNLRFRFLQVLCLHVFHYLKYRCWWKS